MNFDFLKKIESNLKELQSQNGEVIVLDGKRIGPGIGESSNQVVGTTVSPNAEEAKAQEGYENSILGQLYGDIPEKEIEAIVQKYAEKLISDLFKGT